MSRVDDIFASIGSLVPLSEAQEFEQGSSAPTRRSALVARRAINPHSEWANEANATLAAVNRTIRTLKRRRKDRHAAMRSANMDEELIDSTSSSSSRVCPICEQTIRGDDDVMDAHVDSCLAHAALQEAQDVESVEIEAEDGWTETIDDEGNTRLVRNGIASARSAGFEVVTRDGGQDVDDDIDVDGDDEDKFGIPQFSEGDVVQTEAETTPATIISRAEGTDGLDEVDQDGPALRDLVAAGKIVRRYSSSTTRLDSGLLEEMEKIMGPGDTDLVDSAIRSARKSGNTSNILRALEEKIELLESTRVASSTSSLCRICLDPYSEPTVSTGCWHTCCRACWLRCLGATRLCPMCKRITQAAELRRIYL